MRFYWCLASLALLCFSPTFGAVYYVSDDTGSDAFDGLSPGTAFQTVGHLNGLSLLPGDEVRFLCGETWRVQTLVITRSGSPGSPIVFSSHPADCVDKPILSGAQPISGWSVAGTNLYTADLDTGANAGLFPLGLNQLFRGPDRLPFGRWPNIAGHPDGGYSRVDSQPSLNQIRDTALPFGDWTGAVMHIKGIRWYMLNREVASDSGSTLTLGTDVQCWGGDCSQWGYFLNNHLDTLDQEGEWFYDETADRVYLYSELGTPGDGAIEGSAITAMDGSLWGAIVLGRNLQEHISYVTIENLRIERWFDAGITTPINLKTDENSYLVIRNNDIYDVETTGIRLTTWVWNSAGGNGPSGWRGGRNQLVEGNTIDGANHFGLDTYGVDTQILSNEIRNVALIENLGRSGMGCGYSGTNCTENGAGIRLKHSTSAPDHTSRDNFLGYNRIAKVGMNGIDLFGRNTTLENNVIDQACWSKGDCGGIRTFGRDNLATTPVHDVVIRGNIIRDTLGNTDGTHPDFETQFGLGIYLDNYSRDMVVEDNTVTGSTWVGALFQRSTGTFTDNTLYDNVASDWGSELSIVQSPTAVSQSGNVMFPLGVNRRSLRVTDSSYLTTSDSNYFMSPYYPTSVADDSTGCCDMALADWQSWSGFDAASVAHWYTLGVTDPPRSKILINDTDQPMMFNLAGKSYLDLDQQPVMGTLTLGAYSSQILVENPSVIFSDGFESGDTSTWSSTRP